mgnify:FL=1
MENASFENKMQDLEKIVKDLEKGDLSLEESVKIFEKGMKISKECNEILEGAEKRITILLNNNGEIQEKDFLYEGKEEK